MVKLHHLHLNELLLESKVFLLHLVVYRHLLLRDICLFWIVLLVRGFLFLEFIGLVFPILVIFGERHALLLIFISIWFLVLRYPIFAHVLFILLRVNIILLFGVVIILFKRDLLLNFYRFLFLFNTVNS